MRAEDIIRPPDPRHTVRGELREAVRDLQGEPHLFLRLKLMGWHFPGRARLPFVLVGDVLSRFVVIAPDGLSATAYFDRPLPPAERVSFGYGRIVAWDFDVAIEPEAVERLDRERLPAGVVDPFR
jgi:hypothetical protein